MKRAFWLFLLIFCYLFLGFAHIVQAERISDFHADIEISSDNCITVTENITYNFEQSDKHGIYRDILYKVRTNKGTHALWIPKDQINVTDQDGNPRIFKIIDYGDYRRVQIGDSASIESGKKKYVITYKIRQAVNFFENFDEFYWNVTGNEWKVPIEKSGASVILPAKIDSGLIRLDCYQGEYGSREACFYKNYENGRAIFGSRALGPNEGLTIVLGFPKGIVKENPWYLSVFYFLSDNWQFLAVFAVIFILFFWWYLCGRDPQYRGTIVPQYEAPAQFLPIEANALLNESFSARGISAEIINLAVLGLIRIIKIEKAKDLWGSNNNDYEFAAVNAEFPHKLKVIQEIIYDAIANKKLSEIKKAVWNIRNQDIFPQKILGADIANPEFGLVDFFDKNSIRNRNIGMVVGLIFLLAPALFYWDLIKMVACMILGISFFYFSFAIKRKNLRGAEMKENLLGLKMYMAVAEKDRLSFHNAPEKTPEHFDRLLPYAIALGVEKQWEKQFANIYLDPP
ncbi:MAG TPA: DUF2207 domain-containing protein, partial [Candidatus Pacearchaeota archaeon]|nr:DUF2207 domain-containing protein [Candidatus Pacearchaeota archaeon]